MVWHVGTGTADLNGWNRCVCDDDGNTVAVVSKDAEDALPVLAAAPDLLAALELALPFLIGPEAETDLRDPDFWESREEFEAYWRARDAAEVAIAKARGEQVASKTGSKDSQS